MCVIQILKPLTHLVLAYTPTLPQAHLLADEPCVMNCVLFSSPANTAMLLYISLLYYLGIGRDSDLNTYHPVYTLYIIVGVEVMITLPCLIYYIIRATIFNCARQAPDVIHDTYSGPESPTTSVSVVGFRDGEDLDELLERQADMIRYLQQHNANLGRRILELQAQAME